MQDEFTTEADTRRKSGPLTPVLGAVLAAFLLGAATVGYFVWQGQLDLGSSASGPEGEPSTGQAPLALASSPGPSPSPSASASESRAAAQAVEKVEKVAEQQGGLDQRLVAMEQRLAQLTLQMEAASGNAARSEGLLIAFATRRAIERGEPLGYLEAQLKLRFGDAKPNSVQTIIEAGRNPITLDQLLARLEGLAPRLTNSAEEQVDWDWFTTELSQLFVVRRETSPSPQPERRLERARMFLETGRIEAAVAEIRNLPRADEAAAWIASAERYAAAQRALDQLETAAILEPRALRDATGNRVEQLSPASE